MSFEVEYNNQYVLNRRKKERIQKRRTAYREISKGSNGINHKRISPLTAYHIIQTLNQTMIANNNNNDKNIYLEAIYYYKEEE